jgi:uncharacterized protein
MLGFVWLVIIVLNVFVFVLQNIFSFITPFLALVPSNFFVNPWSIVTSMFVHADFEHILYNMFALFFFGVVAEAVVGSNKFLRVYITAGVVTGFSAFIFYPDVMSLGASGAIYGIIGLLTYLRPKMVIYVGFPLPVVAFGFIYVFMDVANLLSPVESNVAYIAHILGFVCGILFGIRWKNEFSEDKIIKKKTYEELLEEEIIDKELDEWERKFMN